jgi:predicted DNA-binding transcriptional regulator AlpA
VGLSQRAVAASLGVTENTVRLWRKAGTFPPPDLDGGWSAEAVARWQAGRLLTPAQAADFLDVSRRSIFLWMGLGLMPPRRGEGRLAGWDPDELRRWGETFRRPDGTLGRAYPPKTGGPRCRHCRRRKAGRLGLCWACRQDPDTRGQYPSGSKFARRGVGLEEDDGPAVVGLPASPTPALPGSPEKVAILEERAAARVALWHPEDPVDRVAPARRFGCILHLADLHLTQWGVE